jgi:hypothetical protein
MHVTAMHVADTTAVSTRMKHLSATDTTTVTKSYHVIASTRTTVTHNSL